MGSTTFSGPVTSTGGFVGDITGAVTGAAMAVTEGSGITSGVGTVVSSEITKVGRTITTHIYIDLTGLASETTLLDIIGDDGAANCHFGQVTVAESGQVYAGSMSCLELPIGGVTDIDVYASSASTGVEGADVSALADPVVCLAAAAVWVLGDTRAFTLYPTATSDYIYLSVGVAGTAAPYTAGIYLIELIGYEA